MPGGTSGKETPASGGDIRDVGLIPGLGRSPRGGYDNPLQYSCLRNLIDRGAWQATVRWFPDRLSSVFHQALTTDFI